MRKNAVEGGARRLRHERLSIALFEPNQRERARVWDVGTVFRVSNVSPTPRLQCTSTRCCRFRTPLLIAQGLADPVMLPAATEAYVDQRCAAGQSLSTGRSAASITELRPAGDAVGRAAHCVDEIALLQ
jgi:hypothetical protein